MNGTSRPARTAAAPLWSVLLVPALGLALGACGAALIGAGDDRPAGGPDTGALVGLVAAAVGCAVVLVWALGAALAVLAVLAGRRRWTRLAAVCRKCSPALLRRAAATALGLQLLAAPGAVADDTPSPFWDAGAAQVVPAPSQDVPDPPPAPEPDLDPGPSSSSDGSDGDSDGDGDGGSDLELDAAPGPALPTPPAPCGARAGTAAAERTVDGAVTIVRGDTLWSLAAAHLGADASDEEIARAWPRWYELNRDVLADGPHRLLPGQRLLVPGTGGP